MTIYPTILKITGANLESFIHSKINPIAEINYSPNWALDFKNDKNDKNDKTFLVTCYLIINGAIYFNLIYTSLSKEQTTKAIDAFHDIAEEAMDNIIKRYKTQASIKGYNPDINPSWKVSITIKSE